VAALLFQGQRKLRLGDAAAALELLERAAAREADSPHVALHRALALADGGRLDDALAALADGAARWPANPVFPLFRGGLLAEADTLDEATAALEGAAKLSPGNLLAEAYMGLVAMRRGEVERALRRLAAVGLTDNPRALTAILAEVEAELFCRFGPNSDGKPPPAPPEGEGDPRLARLSAKRLEALGRARLERGEPGAAWLLLKLATRKNPSLPDLYAHLGFAAHDLGRYEEALDHFDRAGSWTQLPGAVQLHRGASLYKLGRFTEALDALHAAEAADEMGDYTAWTQLFVARTLVALGRVREAREPLRRLLDAEGDMALARLRQARELLGLAVPETAPDGYDVIAEGRTTLVVKPPYADALRSRSAPRAASEGGGTSVGGTGVPPVTGTGKPALSEAEGMPVPPPSGRAPMERIALPDGGTALVRRCRRGGIFGRLLGHKHFSGTRFLRELALSDALRRRGIPTPEVIAGIRHEVMPLLRGGIVFVYRAEIIVREIPGSHDLAAALRSLPQYQGDGGTGVPPVSATGGTPVPPTPYAALASAAKLLRRVHDAGLWHPDLNARNILIAPDGTAMIIDLDRAELFDELPLNLRIGNLARLYRSFHKLGLAPDPVSDDAWSAFYAAYADDDEALLRLAPDVLARCRRELRRHQLWWRITRSGARPWTHRKGTWQ